MASYIAGPNTELPWTSSSEDERRLRRTLGFLSIPFFLLAIVIPIIDVPETTREELEKLPPQLARVVLEKKEIPKPPPPLIVEDKPKDEVKEEPKEEKKPKEKKIEPIEPKVIQPVESKAPKPEPAKLVKARQAAQAEINQFSDALTDMRDAFELEDSSVALSQGTGKAEKVDRNLIANTAKKTSGGVDTRTLSKDTGGIALSGKASTKVDSKLATASGTAVALTDKDTETVARSSEFRSDQDIRRTMDANKGAIYGIYNRALRKNPALEGKVVFKIVIEPTGKVSKVSIISSDLDDPALEKKLLNRIRLINFGAKDSLSTTLEYALDFLPY